MERTASQAEGRRPTISFAITACNESAELSRLLKQLHRSGLDGCEVVVLLDRESYSVETADVAMTHQSMMNVEGRMPMRLEYNHLQKDFASHKNVLNSHCSGEWIFQLDADEYPSESLLMNLKMILESADAVEAIWVPRVNTVEGLTAEDIQRWGWQVNERGWVNFPDYQMRLYRNKPEIKWTKPVHEQLMGYSLWSNLPANEAYALYHPKEIERQRKQNEFYDTIPT